jgi:predicted nucleic acid-binding protein
MPAGDRFFVDTNVLLYSVDPADSWKQERAWVWLGALWESGLGSLSSQVLNEFYVNASGKLRVSRPEAREIVKGYSQWVPVDMTFGLIERAWHWTEKAQVTHWDGLIVSAAERAGCRWLLSEDFQTGRRFGAVTVVNPFLELPEPFGLVPAKTGQQR